MIRRLDPYSYQCGVIDSFCEMVGAGVKPMAFSHAFSSPEEREQYREHAERMAAQYGAVVMAEDALPVTPLFPAGACEGVSVFVFAGSREILEEYCALRDRVAACREAGTADPAMLLEAARELGELLGYSPEAIRRMTAWFPAEDSGELV